MSSHDAKRRLMRKKQPILDVSGDDSSTLEPLAISSVAESSDEPAKRVGLSTRQRQPPGHYNEKNDAIDGEEQFNKHMRNAGFSAQELKHMTFEEKRQMMAVVLESKEQFERESGILESAPVKNEDTDKLSHFAPNTCQSPFARCSPASARQTICRSWRIANQQEASNSSVILGQSSAGPEKRVLDALDDGKNRPALSSFECLKQDALLNSRCTVSLLKNHGVDRRSNRSQLMQNDEIYNRSSVITYASSSTPEVCVGVKEVHQEDCNGNYKACSSCPYSLPPGVNATDYENVVKDKLTQWSRLHLQSQLSSLHHSSSLQVDPSAWYPVKLVRVQRGARQRGDKETSPLKDHMGDCEKSYDDSPTSYVTSDGASVTCNISKMRSNEQSSEAVNLSFVNCSRMSVSLKVQQASENDSVATRGSTIHPDSLICKSSLYPKGAHKKVGLKNRVSESPTKHGSKHVLSRDKRCNSRDYNQSGLLQSRRLPSRTLKNSACSSKHDSKTRRNLPPRAKKEKQEQQCIQTESVEKEFRGLLQPFTKQTAKQLAKDVPATYGDVVYSSGQTENSVTYLTDEGGELPKCETVSYNSHQSFRGLRSRLEMNDSKTMLHAELVMAMHESMQRENSAVNGSAYCGSKPETIADSSSMMPQHKRVAVSIEDYDDIVTGSSGSNHKGVSDGEDDYIPVLKCGFERNGIQDNSRS